MSRLESHKAFIPAYGFAVLIIIGSTLPPNKIPPEILSYDFIIHSVAFAILAILLGVGYIRVNRPKFWKVRAAAASLSVGVMVEVIQFFLPYRNFSKIDLAADLLGVVVALAIFSIKK